MTVSVRWRLLRADTLAIDGRDIALTPRCRAVLLRLLLEANQPVSIDRLADFVWGAALPKTPANSIARFVADLRGALGPFAARLMTDGRGYRLIVHDGELDRDVVRSCLRSIDDLVAHDLGAASAMAAEALDLVGTEQNQSLIGLPDAHTALRVNGELRIQVLEHHVDVEIRRGRHAELVATLERAVAAHPFHETFWAHLMTALDRCGRPTEALRAAARLRQVLAEVGMEPSPSFRAIEAAIVAGSAAGDMTVATTSRRSASASASSPAPKGGRTGRLELVGRGADVAELGEAIGRHRLVTVVGLGGVGKSCLVQAMTEERAAPPLDVVHVQLRSVTEAAQVVSLVAASAGAPPVETAAALAASLAGEPTLLVLDQCELLLEPCRDLIEALLLDAPTTRIVATSRVPLGIDGEYVFTLGPLEVAPEHDPGASCASTDLFLGRVRRHMTDEAAGSLAHDQIGTICRRLGGLPLAIDLAASQAAHLPLAVIAARTEEHRERPPRGGLPALSAVADVLEWSWADLTPELQALLARVSVLAPAWSLAAAEALSGEGGTRVVDLDALVARGLLLRSDTERERFELLAPIRSFAADRLAERHETGVMLERLVTRLRRMVDPFGTAELHAWAHASEVLVPEHGNLEVALTHLSDSRRPEDLVWLAVAACGSWLNQGMPGDVVRWLGPLVGDPFISPAARSAAAAMLMQASHATGDLGALTGWGMTSLELAAGEPHDWIPAVAGFLGMWSFVHPVPLDRQELHRIAASAAAGSRSLRTNHALIAMYEAHQRFGMRQYAEAATLFRSGITDAVHPGRLLLLCEIGETLSIFMDGRPAEAMRSVLAWRSRSDTDEWHYIVDVVRAIVRGAADDAAEATAELAASVRRLRPASVWGRADDFQAAFGLLADHRGERDLSEALLATPISRHILLATVMIEHTARQRGLDDDHGFLTVAVEMWTRTFPDGPSRGAAATTAELVRWWSGDQIGGPFEHHADRSSS